MFLLISLETQPKKGGSPQKKTGQTNRTGLVGACFGDFGGSSLGLEELLLCTPSSCLDKDSMEGQSPRSLEGAKASPWKPQGSCCKFGGLKMGSFGTPSRTTRRVVRGTARSAHRAERASFTWFAGSGCVLMARQLSFQLPYKTTNFGTSKERHPRMQTYGAAHFSPGRRV